MFEGNNEENNQNMENNELEVTKELEELSDLNNQIYEVGTVPTDPKEEIQNDAPADAFFTKPKKVKLKDKIKTWWKNRSKKQKIWIIIGIIFFIILAAVGIYFLVRSLNKKEEPPKPADVIVQEENYRYENGNLIFLNSSKEEIGRYTCENQNEELCFIAYYSDEDDFDTEKKIYEDGTPVKTRSAIVEEKYVFVNDSSKKEDENIKLYNMQDQNVEGTYQNVKKVDQNKFILRNENNLYGMIELTKEMVTKLDFTHQYLAFTPNEKNAYISTQNNRNFIIDETGKSLSKAINGTIKNLNGNYVKVKLDSGKYEVYNYNNQNIMSESFDYIELYDDFAVLINDTKMALKFYDKTKLNEELIELSNKDYIKTSVYDENNTLKETKESFSIEQNNEILTISILNGNDAKTTMINKAEGTLNKSLRNINYFDGKLYIYSDVNKTNLLGTYTCSNKNNVGSGETSLKNCAIASDTIFEDNDYEIPGTVGTIPVFNERFIFISDNPDLVNDSNKTIVLYDLKKNASLGKYSAVNTYSYTGTNDITFSTVTDLQVVAKNQSGNFGVIKINLSDIAGHIGFNYSSMERLRDCYVAKDANGYLLLSKSNGSSLTSAISSKIRNYNKDYVKVLNGSEYQIYDYKGKRITETGYKYIELYDHYFAGVNGSNQLGVYSYQKTTENLISGGELIQLSSSKYYGNGTLAFKIENNAIYTDNVNTGKVVQLPSTNE